MLIDMFVTLGIVGCLINGSQQRAVVFYELKRLRERITNGDESFGIGVNQWRCTTPHNGSRGNRVCCPAFGPSA